MGKSKRSTGKDQRKTGAQPYKHLAQQAQAQVNTFINDLGSITASRRAGACVALCNVFELNIAHTEMLLAICTVELLRALSIRLMDSDATVRLHAAGAVRNLCASKSPQICERIVQSGLIESMNTILRQRCVDSIAEDDAPHTEQLIASLTSLCESHESIIQMLITTAFIVQLAGFTCTLLQRNMTPALLRLSRRSAELIHVSTDNCASLCRQLYEAEGLLDAMVAVCETPNNVDDVCRVHLCGVLAHVAIYTTAIPSEQSIGLLNRTIVVLSTLIIPDLETWKVASQETEQLLQIRNQQTVRHVAEIMTSDEDGKLEEGPLDTNDVIDDVSSLEDGPWILKVTPHTVACEVLANIACALRDDDDNNEVVEWESDDEEKMESMAAAMGASSANGKNLNSNTDTTFLLTQLADMFPLFMQLVHSHVQLLQSGDLNTLPASHVEDFITALDREATVISNGVAVFPAKVIHPVFNSLFELMEGLSNAVVHCNFESQRINDQLGLVMRDCGLCLACLLRRSDVTADLSLITQLSSRGMLLRLVTYPAYQSQLAGIELITACVNQQQDGLPVEHITVLTNCLLNIIENPSPATVQRHQHNVQVMDAALSAVIDLHSGDSEEGLRVYVQTQSHAKLRQATNAFASMIKMEAIDREDRIRYKETLLNLRRFVQYKSQFL